MKEKCLKTLTEYREQMSRVVADCDK